MGSFYMWFVINETALIDVIIVRIHFFPVSASFASTASNLFPNLLCSFRWVCVYGGLGNALLFVFFLLPNVAVLNHSMNHVLGN